MSVQNISVEDFKVAVKDASLHQPIVLFFSASDCQPCHEVEQVLRTLSERYHPRLHVAIVDVSQLGWDEVLDEFKVLSIPDMKVVHQGQRVAQAKGMVTLAEVEALIEPYVLTEKLFRLQQLERQLDLLLSLEQFEEAQEVLEDYISQHPTDEEAQVYHVGVLVRLGDTETAQYIIDQLPDSLKQSERLIKVQEALIAMREVTLQ